MRAPTAMSNTLYLLRAHKMYCFDAGEGRPIVLIHGFSNTGRSWSEQVSSLVERGYRVLVPDLCGHGASRNRTPPLTISESASLISSLIGLRGLENAVVVGVSLGGMIAMQLALDWPRLVQG